ncbi:unnamed protein product [Penicillium olsonii]|uniref:Uncharacterized protein n=1 Tax=Penicillium olsonii TaxID=99116 RepID=A0A9W4HZP9_PENOL|nr:unnamed protein product [Penicillium olsonii]CAG8108111.1 unnamed protein product [Penicillium olsonii]CAG8172878.1 unnamed protein product [Penicillium olsonii]
MHVARIRARGLHIIQSSPSYSKRVLSSSAFSSSPRSAASESTMFKKAVKDHPGGAPKPLHQSDLLRTNASAPPKSQPQSAGVKRKIETESSLGSLHSAVFFTENDFDDDIDFDEPQPPIAPSSASIIASKPVTYPSLDTQPDINYPALPSVSQDALAPPSSMPVPWSSSPPSHYQSPPRKPRSLPWIW